MPRNEDCPSFPEAPFSRSMSAGFLAPIGSSGAVFAAIDVAARPGVQFHSGLGGKFNAGRGNSARSEKANSYP